MQETNPTASPHHLATPQPEKPRRRKILKYFLVSFGIFIGIILLIAVLVPVLFEDKIKALFVAELNKSLATPVTLDEDDIHLSLFGHFPDASLVFNNVGIRESFPKSQKNFLEAKEISLLFNFWNIFRSDYTIKNIVVKDGYCKLVTDRRGNINYKFWKDSEDTTSSDFHIQLDRVDCVNMDMRYVDYQYEQDIDLQLHNTTLSGNFSSDNYTMEATGDLLSRRIKIGSSNYLVNKEAHVDTKLLVNVPADAYTFEGGRITVEQNTFLLDGSIALEGEDMYDLTINGDEIDLAGLMLLLPGDISGNLEALNTKGDINFAATIKGPYTKTKTPAINIDFSVRDGSIRHDKFGGRLDDMAFKGKFTNGSRQQGATSEISISNFTATRDGSPVQMALNYSNFVNPYIDLQLDGDLPASLIIPLAMPDVKDVEGMIKLNNINIKGNIRSFNASQGEAPPTGTITFEGVSCTMNGEKVEIPAGVAVVSNNEITLQQIKLSAAGSTLIADLSVSNWIQHVFPSEMTPALYLNGSIQAEKFDVNGLMTLLGSTSSTAEATTPSSTSETVAIPTTNDPLNISGQVDLRCGKLTYDQLSLENVQTIVKLSPGFIVLSDMRGNTMNGSFTMNTSFRTLPNGELLLQTSGQLASIDVKELFRQLDNFDQTYLTDKNLKGSITANIYDVAVKWNADYSLDEQSIYALCDMRIENGELIEYKALESLSAFVKLSDLKHIKFSTLENKIEITDRTVKLPAMQIRSNAMDLYMSGTHSFDNVIDYQFRISLADLMVRKFLGGNKQQDNYETDAEGGVNVYVSMTGTVDDPVLKYNKREAKQKLQDSGLEQQKFIDIFKRDPEETMFKEANTPVEKGVATDTDTEEIEFIEFEEDDN